MFVPLTVIVTISLMTFQSTGIMAQAPEELLFGITENADKDAVIPGKSQFNDLEVRKNLKEVNKLANHLYNNADKLKSAQGIVELCKSLTDGNFAYSDLNELFKAKVPNSVGSYSPYPKGHYYLCGFSSLEPHSKSGNFGFNMKYFDGKHLELNGVGPMTDPCTTNYDESYPQIYTMGGSVIDGAAFPEFRPSILMTTFLNYGRDEMRGLGYIDGFRGTFDDVFFGLGGPLPDVYSFQFFVFPLPAKYCGKSSDEEFLLSSSGSSTSSASTLTNEVKSLRG